MLIGHDPTYPENSVDTVPSLPGQLEHSVRAASNEGWDRNPFSNSAVHALDAVGRPGVKHRAYRVGAPPINIGHRQHHGSHLGRTRRPIAADCARLLNVVALHRRWLCDQPHLMAALSELRGRDLVCWCAPKPCHGDVLIKWFCQRSRH